MYQAMTDENIKCYSEQIEQTPMTSLHMVASSRHVDVPQRTWGDAYSYVNL